MNARDALTDLLLWVETEHEWAMDGDVCDQSGGSVCSQCQQTGCLRLKIDNARKALKLST